MAIERRSAPLRGRRILVAEDDFFAADDIVQALERAGAEVVGPASDLRQANQIARSGAIDGAILDVNLMGQLSFPVADTLAEHGVPFLFATGYDPAVLPYTYRDVPCFTKPVPAHAIVAAMAAARPLQAAH
ncbi:response regulator [Geminicoccus flavidas]|uniref:response regulator n=1 Tax=Geminicoccus flavidas TaxID=2506407 RepID=UPI00190F3C72|nr:response regulator [Geminicoccus flavidas]